MTNNGGQGSYPQYGYPNNTIDPYYPTIYSTETAALNDFNGRDNTDRLVNFNIAYNINNNSYAASYCNNYMFTFRNINGYLPAAGEIKVMSVNKTVIDNCLTACGGTLLFSTASSPYSYAWSSSRCTAHPTFGCWRVWCIEKTQFTLGEFFTTGINLVVRPVASYE